MEIDSVRCKRPIGLIVIAAVLLAASPAVADPPPDFDTTLERFGAFVAVASDLLDRIVTDNELSGWVNIEWAAFAVCLLTIVGIKYIFEDLTVFDLIQPLMMVAIVRIILDNYDMITSLGWDLSEGIAAGIQRAAINETDPFFPAGFLIDLGKAVVLENLSLFRTPLMTIISYGSTVIILFLTCVMGFFTTVWAMWGYVLCKIIGIFFVPFLMLRRTEFLFDGWLRLYSGFLVYGVIARANLILVVLALSTFLEISGYEIGTDFTVQWEIVGFADILGLIGYLCIGLLSLFCTGRFAATVVSGTAGVGSAINSAAGTVARMASGGARLIK